MLYFQGLNIFFIQSKFFLAILTAFFVTVALGSFFIKRMKRRKLLSQPIREDGPTTHLGKAGTPTFGGVIIAFSIFISSVAIIFFESTLVNLVLVTLFAFALIGFADDFLKVAFKNHKGVPGVIRLAIEFVFAFAIMYVLANIYAEKSLLYRVYIPFYKYNFIELNPFVYMLYGSFIIVGTANATNLTDGLDSLVSKILIVNFATFASIAGLLVYLAVPSIVSSSDILLRNEITSLFLLILIFIGSLIGFLWYNAPPAKVFMGDVGSLSLGACLALIAIMLKHELMLVIVGFVLVFEALSVMIQVFVFKITGKRVFKMAPFHHHLELKGYKETFVVYRMWIFTIILSIISLMLIYINLPY